MQPGLLADIRPISDVSIRSGQLYCQSHQNIKMTDNKISSPIKYWSHCNDKHASKIYKQWRTQRLPIETKPAYRCLISFVCVLKVGQTQLVRWIRCSVTEQPLIIYVMVYLSCTTLTADHQGLVHWLQLALDVPVGFFRHDKDMWLELLWTYTDMLKGWLQGELSVTSHIKLFHVKHTRGGCGFINTWGWGAQWYSFITSKE